MSLRWTGRQWRENPAKIPELRGPQTTGGAASGRVLERAGEGVREGLSHRIVHGDGLLVAGAITPGSVDLVYIDPPYSSDRDYVAEARLDGPADGRARRTLAYEDKWSVSSYLDMLAPRIDALCTLLSARGTIWVHVDWRASHLVRCVLDEILGRDAFVNEIVWRRAPNLGRQAASGQFGRTLDTLIVYGREKAILRPPTRLEPIEEAAIRWDDEGRPFTSAPRGDYTDASIARLETEGRVHRTATGRVYIKYFLTKNEEGVWCRERRVDALWTDIAPLRHSPPSERTGYPTQKPRALLERIITCATEPGSLVVDIFAGSGTTAVAAHALGRRAVLADISPVAIATARARLLREGAPISVERLEGMTTPAAPTPIVDIKKNTVRLVEPAEPLAWAIGKEEDGVFHALWHDERVPGTKPIHARREVPFTELPASSSSRPAQSIDVRVFGDDGSVAEWKSS